MKPISILAAGIALMLAGAGYAIWIGYNEQDDFVFTLGLLGLGVTLLFAIVANFALVADRRRRRR